MDTCWQETPHHDDKLETVTVDMPVTESRRWRVIDSAVWPFKASSEAWCASAGELASEGGGREQAQADVVSTRLITGDQPSLCWGTSGLPPSQRARAQAEWLFKFKFKLARVCQ